MTENGDKKPMPFEFVEGVNGQFNIQYNVYVKEQKHVQNVTNNIKRCNIGTIGAGSESQEGARAGESIRAEKRTGNQAMIGQENPADVTWLTPKLVLFNKRPISRQRNSNVFHGRQELMDGDYRDVAFKLIQYNDKNKREVQILMKLNHQNIVQIYDAGEHRAGVGHCIYIMMELCSMNLEEYIRDNQTYPDKALQFFKQIVAAVDFMHKRNIAHRDIKPPNLLLSKCGDLIKFSDFGISKEIPDSLNSVTTTSYGAGTEGYKAPEVYDPKYKVTLSSDIFSLGLVTAYLLSHGKHPFGENPLDWSYNIRKNKNFDLSQIPTAMSNRQQLVGLIERMLKHAPIGRPTAQEISKEISETLFGGVEDANIVEDKYTTALFDENSEHLYRVDFDNKSLTKMKEYPYYVRSIYTAVSLDRHIYIFDFFSCSAYRLEYSDFKATWKRMSTFPKEHGKLPRVVASSDAIYVVGGCVPVKPTKLVSIYIPALDRWETLKNKQTAVRDAALLCNNEFLYSIGGLDENYQQTSTVERMNLQTKNWSRIANMESRVAVRCVAEYEGKIFVFCRDYRDFKRLFVSSWDPKVDKWTKFKQIGIDSIRDSGWYLIKAFVIDGNFYLVSSKDILQYDVKKYKLSIVMSYDGMNLTEAILIKSAN